MVKPPKGMQPEFIADDDQQNGTKQATTHQRDDFRHYMARKIERQRQQFGNTVLPPPMPKRKKQHRLDFASAVLEKVQRKYGKRRRMMSQENDSQSVGESDMDSQQPQQQQEEDSPPSEPIVSPTRRPDLFFYGVVCLINGYTNPDAETLQRLLQKHGGDVERYETMRVTHILASQLSAAKARMYREQQKRHLWICKPAWVTDSVQHFRRLPEAPYVLESVRKVADNPLLEQFLEPKSNVNKAIEKKEQSPTLPAVAKEAESSPSVTKKAPPPPVSKPTTIASGAVRTTGTDPDFLDSFFRSSRLSFIGSFQQRGKRQRQTRPTGLSQDVRLQRYVLHVDMDCFFASVVLRNYPQHRKAPVAIAHNDDISSSKQSTSECATCNYQAREFGICKGMFLGRAKKLCPELVVLKYDFEGYQQVSGMVDDILQRYAQEYQGVVEKVSCDESFLEIFVPMTNDCVQVVQTIAERIRQDIVDATECTATIGVAHNKFLSKLASDQVKPNQSLVVEDYKELLKGLNLRDLHGIGYRSEPKLQENGLTTVQDVMGLGSSAESELVRVLGPGLGSKIFQFCNGIDERPVQPAERKTIGAECNYGVRFDGPYGVDYMVSGLAKEVEKRMEHVGVLGRKVTLKVKQRKTGAKPPPKFLGHGSCHNLSKSSNLPGKVHTRSQATIASAAMELLRQLNVKKDDIRGMGVIMSELVHEDEAQALDAGALSNKKQMYWDFHAKALPDRESKLLSSETEEEAGIRSTSCNVDDKEEEQSESILYSQPKEDSAEVHERDDEVVELMDSPACIVPPPPTQFDDIELPSASQIHLSQVEEMPSPLRSKIKAKILQAEQPPITGTSTSPPKFRQMDVTRALKLAAVKSGDADTSMSLSQLDQLPLELQLQIANQDDQPLGACSPETMRRKSTSSKTRPARVSLESESLPAAEETPEEEPLEEPPGGMYETDIKPMSLFMDMNDPSDPDVSTQVDQFFELCVQQDRLTVIRALLRSIERRQDEWTKLLDHILEVIRWKHEQIHDGEQLDTEWLLTG